MPSVASAGIGEAQATQWIVGIHPDEAIAGIVGDGTNIPAQAKIERQLVVSLPVVLEKCSAIAGICNRAGCRPRSEG